MQWFRWYHGTSEDTKLRLAARNASVTLRDVIAVWAMVLESASQGVGDGVLKFQEDYIAANLDFEPDEIDKIWMQLEAVGLIKTDAFNTSVTNWGKRQFRLDQTDPTNADRQRRFREKRKGNGSVTDVTPLRNGRVTHHSTDTDTESVGETTSPPAPARRSNSTLEVDEAMREWGSREAPHVDLDAELAKHLDWKRAKAKHFRDPRAAFRNWCRTAEKDALKALAAQPRGSPGREDGFIPRRPADIDQRRLEGFHRTGVWAEGWGPKPVGDAAKRGAA